MLELKKIGVRQTFWKVYAIIYHMILSLQSWLESTLQRQGGRLNPTTFCMIQNWILSKELHRVPVLSCCYNKLRKLWKNTRPNAILETLIMSIELRDLKTNFFEYEIWNIIKTIYNFDKLSSMQNNKNDLSNNLKRLQ